MAEDVKLPEEEQKPEESMSVKALVAYIKERTGKNWEELAHFFCAVNVGELELFERRFKEYQEDTEKNDTPLQNPWKVMVMAAAQMGWNFAIPKMENEDDDLDGLVMGSNEYIDRIMGKNTNEPTM